MITDAINRTITAAVRERFDDDCVHLRLSKRVLAVVRREEERGATVYRLMGKTYPMAQYLHEHSGPDDLMTISNWAGDTDFKIEFSNHERLMVMAGGR